MSINKAQILSVFKGLRNGLQYGSRVRFVHTLVMTFLFKTFNSATIKQIFTNAIQHGKKLGIFVFLYKLSCLLLTKAFGNRTSNNFIAGFVIGGIVFGKKTPINYQINLYLLSRIVTALAEYLYNKYIDQQIQQRGEQQKKRRQQSLKEDKLKKYAFRILAGVVWGVVMWLFYKDEKVLQESLSSSMKFLYISSEKPIQTWKQLIPYSPYK